MSTFLQPRKAFGGLSSLRRRSSRNGSQRAVPERDWRRGFPLWRDLEKWPRNTRKLTTERPGDADRTGIRMRRLLTARFPWRTAGLVAIVAGAAQCATVPVLPPLPTFEEKLSWILRLEDQRVLRDPIPAPPPDPVLQEPASTPLLPPPAAPDLTRLIADPSAA